LRHGIHFISGLPRAGSTLLAAVLRQNPRIYAHMSGPLGSFFTGILGQMRGANEFSVFLDEARRRAILKGVFENYYAAEITSGKLVFDTSRLWCAKMPALTELFPQTKVIACVRDFAWIVDSIERLTRRNPFEMSKIFNFDAGGTVYSRAEAISRGDGMAGFALNALKEAFYGEQAGRLMLVRYGTLTQRPAEALGAIYDFIGEPRFAHDFDNIEFDAEEFDARLGTPGLHRVGKRVKAETRQTVLPPDLFRRYAADNFWNDAALNPRKVPVV
jgi:sulfotransferase